jgi:hypothetical protein
VSRAVATFLFANPSFTSGVARLLDFSGTFDVYNRSSNEEEADFKATLCDWTVVGNCLSDAIIKFSQDIRVEQGR